MKPKKTPWGSRSMLLSWEVSQQPPLAPLLCRDLLLSSDMLLLRRAALSSCASPCSSAVALLLSRPGLLLSAPARTPTAACQNLSTVSGNITAPTAASDLPAVADSSSSTSTPLPAEDALVRAEEQQHRRGFGGKVSLPAEDVLKQVVVAAGPGGGPVELTLRSYHVGSRIHIGQVLARVRAQHPECRTTAGKDYALIWLHDLVPSSAAGPALPALFPAISRSHVLAWLRRAGLGGVLDLSPLSLNASSSSSSSSGSSNSVGLKQLLRSPSGFGFYGPPRRVQPPPVVSLQAAKEHLHQQQQQQQQQRHEVVRTVVLPTAKQAATHVDAAGGQEASQAGAAAADSRQQELQADRADIQQQQQQQLPRGDVLLQALQELPISQRLLQQQQQDGAVPPQGTLQPPFLAVYRSGSIVFGGLEEREELVWLGHFVPPSVRYTGTPGEDPSLWLRGRTVPSVASKEVQKVVVDPACPAYAVQGDDEVRLRVLDVGGVRVLTSVLAQSAALKFYEESVGRSLERLALWRAAHSGSRAARTSGGQPLGFLSTMIWGKKQDNVLFKFIAASAMTINEAQQLLEMAEPAWQYDTYNLIWGLMAQDQQLEFRLKALKVKLHQVETEAKHDVKARAGRRSLMLEQGIILLLAVSCMLAALEAGLKASGIKKHADSSSSSSRSSAGGTAQEDTPAAGSSSSSSSREAAGLGLS